MNFVPRKKDNRKRNRILLGILCFFVCLTGYMLFASSQNKEDVLEKEDFQICGFPLEKTMEVMKSETTSRYMVSDYLFYGESLNLFHEPYEQGKRDDLGRKSIELKNLCTQESITFTLEGNLDRQIDVSLLEEGVYALYVMDGVEQKRLVYQEDLQSDPFYTIQRMQSQNEITLFAQKTYEGHESTYDDLDLFLQVTKQPAKEEMYDVYLDPYGTLSSDQGIIVAGSGNGIYEANEMLEFAQLLKEELEQYDLRVKISREMPDDIKTYYGTDSIMKDAYDSHAKYYFQLGMNIQTSSAYKGMEVYHSNFVSNTLANQIMYEIKNNTSIQPSNAYEWKPRYEGIFGSTLVQGSDGLEYDAFPVLRESGGKGTGAGNLNEVAEQNKDFAKENRQGLYALAFNFIYISNAEDVNIWKTEKQEVARIFAETFVKQANIKK